LAFDWKEYLVQAHFLAGSRDYLFSEEAALRSAVSRAYYAVFCYSRNYARDQQGFVPRETGADHKLVREHFQRRGQTSIAIDLDQLLQWRNQCDYDDVVGNLDRLTTNALENAQGVIDSLI